ncbi:hypothetical protein SUGI_0896570 [Cryptomeria japonica]|uniref:zinc finger protein CONSTANS-LIKE 4 n=1 Tax=Cryptomeria japonica TaxID=3369 RepID=UPI0024147932|nr:zinc finger protein CONSTANS-LIKE 4 [Cryptomeria japonica]GLJ43189.1 hypothetical protein SUGI_0896570 [Cryptomeria japonica]
MVKDEDCHASKDSFRAWSIPKLCDACRITSCLLYCKADSAYLCMDCDLKVHGANKLASRHERVWMCEVCEQAPAAVTCKADAAVLCLTCDADIHSANPLARRHDRLPVVPFFDCAKFIKPSITYSDAVCFNSDAVEDDDLAASWLFPNPKHTEGVKNCSDAETDAGEGFGKGDGIGCQNKGCFVPEFFPDVDPYLDLEYASSMDTGNRFSGGMDSVVPVQSHGSGGSVVDASTLSDSFDADPSSCKANYSYTSATSFNHSLSSSSLDVGVVPDVTVNDISTPFKRVMVEVGGQGTIHCIPLDREARVMRYKEKRKNRKFEKTIRYASRKAYAETRPRIKGRFAKRTDVDVDQMYASVDLGYGLVPSF